VLGALRALMSLLNAPKIFLLCVYLEATGWDFFSDELGTRDLHVAA
jgi:hypothetical protein